MMSQGERESGRIEDPLCEEIIGAAIEVHRHLGPGLLESAYELCFCHELSLRSLRFERQRPVPVDYKGMLLGCGYMLDIVVEGRVLVELKTVERLLPIHVAQVITYLKLTDHEIGLLMNFNVPLLRDGIRRLTKNPPPRLPLSL